MFGPPDELARNLRTRIEALGITACVAVSGNFHTAVAVAKAPLPLSVRVFPQGEESTALAALPLTVFDLSERQAEYRSEALIHITVTVIFKTGPSQQRLYDKLCNRWLSPGLNI